MTDGPGKASTLSRGHDEVTDPRYPAVSSRPRSRDQTPGGDVWKDGVISRSIV